MKNNKLSSIVVIMVMTIFVSVFSINTPYVLAAALTDISGSSSVLNPPNLIPNPSVEAVDCATPCSWLQAGFGTNNRAFNYPVAGYNSASAINVTISTYTDGDAKWYFTEVPVTPTRTYLYTDNYISNAPTQVVAEYFDASHAHLSYDGFIAVPQSPISPANSWGSFNTAFIPPSGAAFMTVYHLLNRVGSLTTDNFSLTEVPLPQQFDKGYVSLTFDDGFLNQYQNVFPKLTTANIKGTFYIVSHVVSGLSIKNSSLENANGTSPADWANTGGSNATFTYPVAGHTGASGAQVTSTVSGSSAGWFFNPISVVNDSIYSVSQWYKSTTDTELVALITNTNGITSPADITDATGKSLGTSVSLPSTDNTWAQASFYFYVPTDAKTITIQNRLVGVGDVTIDDTTLGDLYYMNSNQVKDLFTAGQEIGGHTQSHKDLSSLSTTDARAEITGGLNDILVNGGITSVLPFDYPYGNYTPSTKQLVQDAGFTSARTVTPGFNGKDSDRFALKAQSVNANTTLATVQSWITQAMADHTWLILVFHEIQDNLTNAPYGTTPANFQAIVDYLKTNNIPTQTVSEGASQMNGGVIVPPTVTLNSIAITTPATKLSYTIGDPLNITGLVVTGTYSDNSSKTETITVANVTGFNSTTPVAGQVLTITVGGKTTNYTVNVVAPVTPPAIQDLTDKKKGFSLSGSYPYPRQNLITKDTTSEKVLGAEIYRFNSDLKYGMKNSNSVKELQKKLQKHQVYNGPITGNFGTQTRSAVMKYQELSKLPITGFVGPMTRGILNAS